MTNYYDIFISDKRKDLPVANCRPSSNVVLLRSSFGVPLVLLWFSYGALIWTRSALEKGSKVMRRFRSLKNISSF